MAKLINPSEFPIWIHELGQILGSHESVEADPELVEERIKTGVLKAEDAPEPSPEPVNRTDEVRGSEVVEQSAPPKAETR